MNRKTNESLDSGHGKARKQRKWLRITGRILICIAAIWIAALIAVQVTLSPAVLTRLANRFSAEYIDGNVSFGNVSLSVIKSFPNIRVTFDTVSVTYPSDRFAGFENGRKVAGRGNGVDTLMSFSRFSAALNVASLGIGQIGIPSVILDKPRIFARNYGGDNANWNIFKTSQEGKAEADTAAAGNGMPRIVLGRIHFGGKPLIIYHSAPDTTDIVMNMKQMQFNGRISSGNPDRKRIGLKIDSMIVAGRFPADTLALALDMFRIGASKGKIFAKAEANTYMATRGYGRIRVPVKISTGLIFPQDSIPSVSLKKFSAEIAGIPLKADADLKFSPSEGIYINGNAAIEKCKISDVLKYINRNIWKEASEIQTDAEISLVMECDGWYSPSSGIMPEITASLLVPDAGIRHRTFRTSNRINIDAGIEGNSKGNITLALNDFSVSGKAMDIFAKGSAEDITGKDPLFDIEAGAMFRLDTLGALLKKGSGISTSGNLSANVKGRIRMSQINPYRFADADVSGFVRSDRLNLKYEKADTDIHLDSLDIWLGAVGNTQDKSVSQGERMIALTASVDSAKVRYGNAMFLKGRHLSLKAQNSAAILDRNDSSRFYPFGGRVEIGFLSLLGADTTAVLIADSENTFKISPKAGNAAVPVLSLQSSSKGIFLRGPVNRLGVSGLSMNATAAMNSIERRQKARAFVDSLARRYPDIPRDSLFSHLHKMHGNRKIQIPDWLSENDFRKKDLQISVDSSIVKILRDWDADGSISFRRADVMTPLFPLRNSLHDVQGRFNNNEIDLESFSIRSGTSVMSAKGSLSGLRGAVAGRGIIGLNMDIESDSLNINELLGAYSAGTRFSPATVSSDDDITGMDDSEYQDMFVTDTLADMNSIETSLIVIPANINAKMRLSADNVRFADLDINRLQSELTVKERCVQFVNTYARSDIGNIRFEGFYSSRTKKDLKTGFDLSLNRITAEKVIELIPAVDSIMPMLKSFKGELDCEVAATAGLDTCMNIITPSINGVVSIGGKNLTMQDSEAFQKIAKKLKFKDRENWQIENMSVQGVLHDSRLEIFPFVLAVDRYTLAMSGVQNLDSSFKYHISVIDSPIPFRVGLDISGNFDDFKFRIGKAKYKSANVPVFSGVVDQTRLNLRNSIEKIFSVGVDKAIRENERQKAIEQYKSNIDYTEAVDEQLDSLSTEEQAQLGE